MSVVQALCRDVWDRIFERLEGRDIARLHETGDTTMQNVVAHCAKRVRFDVPHFATFPSIALSLPSMCALKVETLSVHGAYPLHCLPSSLPVTWHTLSHMSFNYRQSFDMLPLLAPLSSLTYLACSGSATALVDGWEALLPQNLNTLKLFTHNPNLVFTDCEHLPRSLRRLKTDAFSLGLKSPSVQQPLQWPPYLEQLSLHHQVSFDHDYTVVSLPPLLTKFDYATATYDQLRIFASHLPVCLRSLKCVDSVLVLDCNVLPPNLQVCVAGEIEFVHGIETPLLPAHSLKRFDIYTKTVESIRRLQPSHVDLPNLTSYRMEVQDDYNDDGSVAFKDLSRYKFESLHITYHSFSKRYDKWRFQLPVSVKTLYVDSFQIDDSIAPFKLPHGLTKLNLTLVIGITLEAWQSLPSSIVELSFQSNSSNAPPVQLLSNLPPKLEKLHFYIAGLIEERDAFESVPSSLKSVSIDIYMSATTPLEAWIYSVAARCPLETISIRIRANRRGLKKDISRLLTYLPNTLRSLIIMGTGYGCTPILSNKCFEHMPRRLTCLSLDVSRIIGELSNFGKLPPSLESFKLRAYVPLLEDILDYMPPAVLELNPGYSLQPAAQAALDRYYARGPWRSLSVKPIVWH